MARKFYRTIVTVEVLSEDSPWDGPDLQDLAGAITHGDCSGQWDVSHTRELTAQQAAQALIEQGSEPGFFQLDEHGNDLIKE
jgi:hypothetical protein